MRLIQYVMPLITAILLLSSWQISAANADAESDLRILIDVSGSMKMNDPKNLRAPALRMVVGLLPEEAKAGAWTFGEHVNMVVPFNKVNDNWKLKAQQQSKKIHSLSLFTDIEKVLNKATEGQHSKDERYQRSVILLSDGLVDVSKEDSLNEQSRQRILNDIIPRLKEADVAVHTIALSENADHELLRAMSLATDGWHEQVDDADALQRVFLHLFEKAAQRDTVPLSNNQFKIDESVSEMTLLVFRKDGTDGAELVAPDQSILTHDDKSSGLRWHSENNYDLVTIDNPTAGEWGINADVDPDNRVMVVTDLKLKTTDLPNNILIGESFDFDVSLTEKGEVIERQDFLKLVDAQLLEESEIADPIERDLNKEQQKGLYRTHVGDTFQPGRNDVVVTMTSATFERQRRQSINVVEMPFDINIERLPDQETRTHRLVLTPDTALIKAENLVITAMLTAEDGNEWSYDVMKNGQEQWQLTLAELQEEQSYTVALQIKGETVKGRSLFLQPDPIVLEKEEVTAEDKLTTESPESELEENSVNEIVEDELDVADEPIEDEMSVEELVLDEMEGDDDSLLPDMNEFDETIDGNAEVGEEGMSSTLKLAIGNGLIVLLLIIGFFIWRKKQAAKTNPGDLL